MVRQLEAPLGTGRLAYDPGRAYARRAEDLLRSLTTLALTLAALGLAAITAAPIALAGACAMPSLWVRIAADATRVIPSDQGILLELGTDPRRAIGPGPAPYSAESAIAVTAHLAREGQPDIALRVEAIGPSVARLVPATTPASGRWRVVTATHSEEVSFGAQPARGNGPAAPRLVSVTRTEQTFPGPRGSDSYLSISARLRGALPASVAGVVLFAVHGTTERAAITQSRQSLASLHTGAGALVLFARGGCCSVSLPAQDPSVRGTVRLAAYDLDGRLGARSNDVTVTGAD